MNLVAPLLLCAALFAGTARAASPQALEAAYRALHVGAPVEFMDVGQPAVAVPFLGYPCATVGVLYPQARSLRRGDTQRIDHYRACPDGSIEALDELSPSLPDDEEFRQATLMTIRAALRRGAHFQRIGAYRVDARRLFGNGQCAEVETVISTQGLLVSYNVGQICP